MRIGPRWLMVIVTLLIVVPVTLAAADDIRDAERELEQTQQQQEQTREQQAENERALDAARQDLHHASQQVAAAQQELQAIEGRLATATGELEELEAELEEAIAAHKRASDRVDAITRQLIGATNRMQMVELDLAERQGAFDSRVAATYKYGTVTYAQVLVDARDFGEFLDSYYYVRSAMGYDQILVDEITLLTRELAAQRAEVAQLRDVARDEQVAAEAARDHVTQLAAQQRELTDQIAAERDRQRTVTAELETARQDYERQYEALEQESNQLAAELRALEADAAAREAEIERMRQARRSGGSSGGNAASGGGNCQAGWTPREFAWPTNGCVTSGYGYRTHPIYGGRRLHSGADIPAPTGQAIYSATDGYVVSAGWRGGYGLTVVVDHGGGIATLYAHMSAVSVSAGQFVGHAEQIGHVGSTGQSTGPHLHFEVRVNGNPQDPMNWY